MKIDHVGWITDDIEAFERFWCGVLGFQLVYETTPDKNAEMLTFLFDIDGGAWIRRYRKEEFGCDIEIHKFKNIPARWLQTDTPFYKHGINHVCLNVPDKDQFLASLPVEVIKKVYNNPKGWKNAFIKDFEGNWVEIREPMV